MKYCVKNCVTMVLETLLWIGLTVILKTKLSWSSLAPLGPTTGKSHVVFHRVQFLGLSCLLCMLTVSSLSQSYCVPMVLVFFVLIRILINSFPSLLTNLTKISIWLKANKLSLNLSKTDFVFPSKAKENYCCFWKIL